MHEGLAALSTTNNLTTIRALMLELQPKSTLEIGMAFGGSALTFAQSHKDLGREGIRHTAIDPAQSKHWDEAGRLALERAGLSSYVEIIEELSSQALPLLSRAGRKYSMAYIDGSHMFEDVLLDFLYTHDMLDVGGLVLFDDSTDLHVRKVLRFINASYSEIYEPVSLSRFRDRFKARARYELASRLRKTQLRAFRKLKDGRQNWDGTFKDF